MPSLTTSDLRDIGMTARKNNAILGAPDLPGKDVRGCCIDIMNDVRETLMTDYDLPEADVTEYRCNVGEAMELHYATGVASRHISDVETDAAVTIVDPAIDQFCTEQAEHRRTDSPIAAYEELPRVAILPPGDDRRPQWYHDPHGQYDPDSEFKPV